MNTLFMVFYDKWLENIEDSYFTSISLLLLRN